MCSIYTIQTPLSKIAARFNAAVAESISAACPERMAPKALGPVVYPKGGVLLIEPMQFSLLPSWAKERKLKFATHNARLDNVETKPAWRDAFLRSHCVVPMDEFIEGIYTGIHAGNMMAFRQANGEPFYAAGIYDSWRDKDSGECILSYAILTTDAEPFVAEAGHNRQPLFLSEHGALSWLHARGQTAAELKKLLMDGRLEARLSIWQDRPLKPGWEKRKAL